MVVVVIIIIIMSIVQLMESPGKPQGPTPTRCLVESHSSRMADPLCTVQKLCFHCNHVSLLANTQIHTKIYNIILLFGYIYMYTEYLRKQTETSVWICICVILCVCERQKLFEVTAEGGANPIWSLFPFPDLVFQSHTWLSFLRLYLCL